MFTIKVILKDGSEFLKSDVTSVAFNPPIQETGKSALLFIWYLREPAETLYSGKIYVMNENGKTVGDYHLFSNHIGKDIL